MSSQKLPGIISGFGKSFFIGLASIGAVAVNFAPTLAEAAKSPRTDRSAEIVVDADTGTVIYEDNATARRYPASITKVMTLYLLFDAIESGRVGLDDQIVFSRNADNQPPTALGVRAGDSISVEAAILSLALRSANDSATAVAEFIGGTERQFAQMMNVKARELGMNSTNFTNASGLPNPNQYTTAEDLAKLAIAIRRDFPRQFHWFSRQSFVFDGQVITNHNHLVGKYDGVDGLKTGYIRSSGFNLAATATRGGRRIVTVVMGGPNRHIRDERVVSLLNNAFASLGVVRMGDAGAVNFSENSDDERDGVDNFALASQADEYSPAQVSQTNTRNYAANINANQVSANPSTAGFTWRTPSTSQGNSLASISSNTSKSPIISANSISRNNIAAQTPTPTRVNFASSTIVNEASFAPKPAATVTQIIEVNTPPLEKPITITENNPTEPLPQFFVTARIDNNEISGQNDVASFEIKNSENEISNTLASNEGIKAIETMRQEAAERESARLKEIELAEAAAEVERLAQIKQKQAEARRLAEIQRRADERRERQRIQIAEAEAKEARAKAEKQERDRQIALANQRGDVTIQIGAFKERGEAQRALASMARHFPSFANKQVTTFTQSGNTWFRARVSGLGNAAAEAACRAVTRSGGRCSIVSR